MIVMQLHTFRLTSIACLLLGAASVADAGQDAATEGTANCRATSAQPAACLVEWTWQKSPRAYGSVQQFDPSIRRWRTIADAPATRSGVSQDTVEDGYLYRVLGCDDVRGAEASASSSCSTTTVFWAPYRPATVNDIPEVVADRYGSRQTVSKKLSYDVQVTQYNGYQLILHLEGLDRSVLPAMTPPRPETVPDWTVWDTVAYNVHNLYEAYREMDREAKQRPATREDSRDWWRPEQAR
jgi:hypothetical protein